MSAKHKSLDKKPRSARAEAATRRPNKAKHANSRNALERSADIAFLARWRSRGLNTDALHLKLNEHIAAAGRKVSRSQVGFDMKQVDAAWRAQRDKDVYTLKDAELAAVAADLADLYEAWELSKLTRKWRKVKQLRDGAVKADKFTGTEKTEKTFEEEDAYGDPSIMEKIIKLREYRARICGWLAPVKVTQTDPDGAPVPGPVMSAPVVTIVIKEPERKQA